jgi:hypothetical protein
MDKAQYRRRRTENNIAISSMFRRKSACPILCIDTNTMTKRSAYGKSKLPRIIRWRWLLRGCPKCRGDLYYSMEPEGEYMHCLQCGYEGDA